MEPAEDPIADSERRTLVASAEECRRVLHLELDESHRQREVTARILQLGVALLAGAIAMMGLTTRTDSALPMPALAGIAVSVGLNLMGTAQAAFLVSGPKDQPHFAFGPDLAGLDHRLDDPDWSEADLERSLVTSHVTASDVNIEFIARLARGRRTALVKLALGVAGYFSTLVYILARGI